MPAYFHIYQILTWCICRACFKCGEVGHSKADCPQAGEDSGERKKGCFKCGEEGHNKADCPQVPQFIINLCLVLTSTFKWFYHTFFNFIIYHNLFKLIFCIELYFLRNPQAQ